MSYWGNDNEECQWQEATNMYICTYTVYVYIYIHKTTSNTYIDGHLSGCWCRHEFQLDNQHDKVKVDYKQMH
mgnify:CR=1 FL=1